MRRITIDKRIQRDERAANGACADCERRHIHRDDCPALARRIERPNDGTDPDQPPVPYAGGMLS